MVEDFKNKTRGRHHSQHRMHPNSLANLRPQRAGEPGHNPNGRPKNPLSITSRQKEKLLEVCPFDAQGRTWVEALAEGGLRQALNIPTAMENLQDRHEGKVTDTHEFKGELVLRIVDDEVEEGKNK